MLTRLRQCDTRSITASWVSNTETLSTSHSPKSEFDSHGWTTQRRPQHKRELTVRMAEKGVWLTPTLTTTRAIIRPPFADFLPPSGQAKCKLVNEQGLKALKVSTKIPLAC